MVKPSDLLWKIIQQLNKQMSKILLNKVFPGTPVYVALSRGPWPHRMPVSVYVVNAQTHISSGANQSQKDKKGDGQGTAKVSKRNQRLGYNPRFQWISTFILLYFMIANFYITFEYYVNCTGRNCS